MAELSISIDFEPLKTEAKRVLASYGKRRKDNQGGTLFAGITTSSKEDAQLEDFVWKGIEVFLGEMAPLVSGNKNEGRVTVVFNSTRVNEAKQHAFELNLKSFVVEYVLVKVLQFGGLVNEGKEAEADLQRHLDAAVKLMFTVDAPTSNTKNLNDMSGDVILE